MLANPRKIPSFMSEPDESSPLVAPGASVHEQERSHNNRQVQDYVHHNSSRVVFALSVPMRRGRPGFAIQDEIRRFFHRITSEPGDEFLNARKVDGWSRQGPRREVAHLRMKRRITTRGTEDVISHTKIGGARRFERSPFNETF